MALLLIALVAIQPSYAGHYQYSSSDSSTPPIPGPSGGEIDDAWHTIPLANSVNSQGTNHGAGDDDSYIMAISSTITSTYAWVPDSDKTIVTDPPPTCVLVHRRCEVVAAAEGDGATADASSGVGGTDVNNDSSTDGSLLLDRTGEDYYLDGGATITVHSCTPTGDAFSVEDAELDIGYSDDVTPIVITFDSPVIGYLGAYQALVGQKLTAHLSIGPDNNIYNWTIDGCDPFDAFLYDAEHSEVIDIDPSIYSIPSPTIHCRSMGSVGYACSGVIHGQSFNVTENVGVQRPTIALFNLPHGTVGIPADTHIMSILTDPSATDGTQTSGISFDAEVDIPAPFTGVGTFYFIQKIMPQRIRYGSTGSESWSLNGRSDVLDNSAPYGTGLGFSATTFSTGTDSTNVIGDTPPFGVDLPNYNIARVNGESFETYLMFTPPGDGSQSVTIAKGTWNWSGILQYSLDPATSIVDYRIEGGSIDSTPGSASSEFPLWNENWVDGTFNVVVDL